MNIWLFVKIRVHSWLDFFDLLTLNNCHKLRFPANPR